MVSCSAFSGCWYHSGRCFSSSSERYCCGMFLRIKVKHHQPLTNTSKKMLSKINIQDADFAALRSTYKSSLGSAGRDRPERGLATPKLKGDLKMRFMMIVKHPENQGPL